MRVSNFEQIKVIQLWSRRIRSKNALNHWVQRMTARLNGGVGVAEVGWLDAPLAVKVLAALKKWSAR
ncbi:phage protein GemA/Gp16 family protein [Aeromonas hydrophila]|uniref:phage protein GemA/Gp16 family protein n=1 Tax=Aeromonas hydrophila TaxID=644 RepID=UPI0039773848